MWLTTWEGGAPNVCPDGTAPATQDQCAEAVEEASNILGLEWNGQFATNEETCPTPTSSGGYWNHVPPGCSYSKNSKRALFNVNPNGVNNGDYKLMCYYMTPPLLMGQGGKAAGRSLRNTNLQKY